jgi:hypothetical protein
MAASKDPHARSPEANRRAKRDHAVLADPDVRGARKGRLGQGDDERYASGNDPGRVERAWKRAPKGGK